MRRHVILAVLQLLLVLGFAFGDIGFDRPGRYGLDFGHGLLILGLFVVLWIWGTVAAMRRKTRPWVAVQTLLPVFAVSLCLVLGV